MTRLNRVLETLDRLSSVAGTRIILLLPQDLFEELAEHFYGPGSGAADEFLIYNESSTIVVRRR